MELKPPKADELIEQIDLKSYVSDAVALEDMSTKCRAALAAQIEIPPNREEQVETALEFIKALWKKYDCLEVATRYEDFVKVEEALFGLERQEDIGKRYRDHFVHMFNCYIFGLRLISSVRAKLETLGAPSAKQVFKVEDEDLEAIGLPFGDYPWDRRLFFLWTLISTFHDIAIPFEHLEKLGDGIGKFLESFGWLFGHPKVSMHSFDSSQLHCYFNLIGATYGGKLESVDHGRKYKKACGSRHYIAKLLGREFDLGKHGVLSGFLMWKTIEEIWLLGKSEKHEFTKSEEFDSYTEYVLEQDIARAALAISLHAIDDKDEKCMVYPVRFDQYPLAFLLILADELQEYLRWEGTTLKGEVNITSYPILSIECPANDDGITVDAKVSFSVPSDAEEGVVEWAKKRAEHDKSSAPINDLGQATDYIGNSVKKTLERKLKLGENFKVKLSIYQDWDKTMYSKDLASPK